MTSADNYSRPLIGRQLTAVEKRDYSWIFRFGDDAGVMTESAWRLMDGNRIVVASEDHGHKFGLPAPVDAVSKLQSFIVGRTVEAAEISMSSGDLIVAFGGTMQLQFLQLSSGYESWRLSVQGAETICTGGGGVAHFPRA